MNKIRKVVLVGAGHIGIKHINCIAQYKNSIEIKAIVEPSTKSFNKIEELIDEDIVHYETLDQIDFSLVNTALICSPSFLHFSQINFFLGKIDEILCEKPLLTNLVDVKNIRDALENSPTKIVPILQVRHSNASIFINNNINIDDVNNIAFTLYWNRDKGYFSENNWRGTKNGDGGILLNQSIHYFDFLASNFGNINNLKVKGTESQFKESDLLDILYGECFFGNTPAKFFLTVSSPINQSVEMELDCKNQKVLFKGNNLEHIFVDNKSLNFSNKTNHNLHQKFYNDLISNKINNDLDSHINLLDSLIREVK